MEKQKIKLGGAGQKDGVGVPGWSLHPLQLGQHPLQVYNNKTKNGIYNRHAILHLEPKLVERLFPIIQRFRRKGEVHGRGSKFKQ